jgi:hypothetical protein
MRIILSTAFLELVKIAVRVVLAGSPFRYGISTNVRNLEAVLASSIQAMITTPPYALPPRQHGVPLE